MTYSSNFGWFLRAKVIILLELLVRILGHIFKFQCYISWSLPDEGWIKINTDGSVNQYRGLLRDDIGQYVAGFAVNLGFCPITVAEIWVAFYGLHLAWQEGYKQVILELDSSATVALILKDLDDHHPLTYFENHGRSKLDISMGRQIGLQIV